MSDFNTKYFRSLKDFDFENINKKTFKILVDTEIFNEIELNDSYVIDDDFFKDDNDIAKFGNSMIHDFKEYSLKDEILTEMIYVMNNYLKIYDCDIQYYIDEIQIIIMSEFKLENKIMIVEDNYKKRFSTITDKKYYPLFKDDCIVDGYTSWENYLYDEIIDSEKFDIIAKFLNGDMPFLPADLHRNWIQYYIFSGISDYCSKKNSELMNPNLQNLNKTNHDNPAIRRNMSFRLSFFELLMKYNEWDDLNPTQKGNLLTHLFGDHPTNIRDYYLELAKKNPEKFKEGGKWDKEIKEAEEIIKKQLG